MSERLAHLPPMVRIHAVLRTADRTRRRLVQGLLDDFDRLREIELREIQKILGPEAGEPLIDEAEERLIAEIFGGSVSGAPPAAHP